MPTVATIDVDAAVSSIVRQVVEAVHPVRIILFGSHARGDARPDSDVDLLIVMPDGASRRETARKLYRSVEGGGFSKDFLVVGESDLAKHADNIGLIYITALREGRVIYES